MKLFTRLFVVICFFLNTLVLATDFQIRSTTNKESDAAVAYNSTNDEYLVVWTEWASSTIPVMGQRMKGDGSGLIGAPFTIFQIGAYPSVAYNSQTNEYLVTAAAFGIIQGQRVRNTGTLVGSSATLINKSNSIWPKIVYNTLGNNFLLVGAELFDLGNDQANIKIYTMKILANGQPSSTEQLIRDQPHGNYSDGARFSVAYAPITSTETPTGRYLLAIDTPADLTMLDDNGLIVSKVINSYNGSIVGDHIPFEQSQIGEAHNLDVAFGYWEGENAFMIVWGDQNNQADGHKWTGIWSGIVNATPIEYDANASVSNTVFPVSSYYGLIHNFDNVSFKSWKPVVAYNKVAGKFMISWRETPSNDPNNTVKVNHIRANAVESSVIPIPPNVVLSAVTGSENPMNPAIAASEKTTDALVVWDDSRNISTKDIDLYGTIFQTAGANTLTLTSPNGSEMLGIGTQQSITWQSTNIGSFDVSIEYSTDYGATYNFIAFQTNTDGTNTYNWTVPNTPSTQCIVKISVSGLIDESDQQFTIVDPTISIVEPNGGEKWYVGSTQQILWNNYYFSNAVKIEYSTDNGSSYSTIISSAPNIGTYSWKIPNAPSTQCLVRVSDAASGYPIDISDAVFTILAAKLTITSPNGGENWGAGTKHNITWTSQNIPDNDVSIEYSTDNGNSYSFIGVQTNNQPTESFEWIVPSTPSSQCLVRISLYMQGVEIVDVSDAPFTISQITVISPNGGEIWKNYSAGGPGLPVIPSYAIDWKSTNFSGPVRVGLKGEDVNGKHFNIVLADSFNNIGIFIWTLGENTFTPYNIVLPLKVKIRVADAQKKSLLYSDDIDDKIFDWSDSEFTIVDTSITVISPNGGEIWTVGSQQEIRWTSLNYTGPVRIDILSTIASNMNLTSNIVASTPNDGAFILTGNEYLILAPPCQAKIRVADATKNDPDTFIDDGKIYDWSDAFFTINPAQNTSTGNNIIVDLGDETIITFDNVTTEGLTTLDIMPTGSPVPNGFEVFPANAPEFYNIETTAEFIGNIELRMNYNDSTLTAGEESDLELFVYDTTSGNWHNITTFVNTDSNYIKGHVSHLSEFAIMLPNGSNVIVTNTNDTGAGSLRNAIEIANTNLGADIIKFNIPKTDLNFDVGKGIWTIKPDSSFEYILDNELVIDGLSQSSYLDEDTNPEGPEIVIDGSNAGQNASCFVTYAHGTEFYELTINRFGSTGIIFYRPGFGVVSGCYIGTDYSGMIGAGNKFGIGLWYRVEGVHIGPTEYASRNIISGSTQTGIFIADSSYHNVIVGNYIGLNRDGTSTISNYFRGIDLERNCDSNEIFENYMGGNGTGISLIQSNNNQIAHNLIGTNESWSADFGNGTGIQIWGNSSNNKIIENIIGYNFTGIVVDSANSLQNIISRNMISINDGLGIDNRNGGNLELAPPKIITILDNQISGTAGANQIIEIFADSSDEGQLYIDSTISDASGNFTHSFSEAFLLPINFTATARDDLGNTSEFSSPFIVTDIEEEKHTLPTEYALYQNYPNPFNPSTVISWQLLVGGHTTIKVYDVLGKEVVTLVNTYQSSGFYNIEFNGNGLSSGVYFYKLNTKSSEGIKLFSAVKKLIMLK